MSVISEMVSIGGTMLSTRRNSAELTAFRNLGEMGYMTREHRQALAFIRNNPEFSDGVPDAASYTVWAGYWSLSPEYLRGEPLDPANIFFCTTFDGPGHDWPIQGVSQLSDRDDADMLSSCLRFLWFITSLIRRFPIGSPSIRCS